MSDFLRQSAPVLIFVAICAVLVGGIAWFVGGGAVNSTETVLTNSDDKSIELQEPIQADPLPTYNVEITNDMNPIAVLNTNRGVIKIELFENQMPITAGNFAKLVKEGFYDGTKFHRVIDGFMIQGGDPITKTDEVIRYGTGGPGYTIPDEHIKSDLLTNVRGTIAMANSGPDSGGSQFFINLVDNTNLDFDKPPLTSKHPVFGRVIEGMDVVDKIGKTKTTINNLPAEDIVIESATIE